MEQFDNEKIVHFEIQETLCFGVEERWGKYHVPIQVDDESKQLILNMCKEKCTQNPIHGKRTLYLKIEGLTLKQRIDLLGRGKTYVHVKFDCRGVFTNNKDSKRYLVFKLKKLAKLDKEVELEMAED